MGRKKTWRQKIWGAEWTFKLGKPSDPDSEWEGPRCRQPFAETIWHEKRVYINPEWLDRAKFAPTPEGELINTLAHESWHITDDTLAKGGGNWKGLTHDQIYDLADATAEYVTGLLRREGILPKA